MSTIKANKLEHISTSNGGIQLDNAGHVTVDGQQMPTAGALGNRNLIINGAMTVAQRGTGSTAQGYTTVDRIKTMTSDTNTRSQQSLASSDTPYSYGFRKFYRLANDTASSAGASTYREIDYRVESQDIAGSGWNYTSSTSYVTFSFWARASVSQTYYMYLFASDASKARYFPITLTANTWTKIEQKIPGDSSLQFDNNNESGLTVRFVIWYGSTYAGPNAPADTWFTNTGDYVPTMSSTWATTAGATFDFTGLQLEVGEKSTPFEHRSFGDELARCMRYYETGVCFGMYKTSDDTYGWTNYSVQKRANPSVELNPPGSNPSNNQAYYWSTDTNDRGNRAINEINPSNQVGGQSNFKNGFIATMGGFTPASTNDAMWTSNYIAEAEL